MPATIEAPRARVLRSREVKPGQAAPRRRSPSEVTLDALAEAVRIARDPSEPAARTVPEILRMLRS